MAVPFNRKGSGPQSLALMFATNEEKKANMISFIEFCIIVAITKYDLTKKSKSLESLDIHLIIVKV